MGYSKVIKSGKLLEIWEYERDLPNVEGRRHSSKTQKPIDIYNFKKNERRKDNLQKQKQSFIRICLSNLGRGERVALCSLTYATGFSYDQSLLQFSSFISALRKKLGKAFRYIAVPEFQTRGTLHFHILFFNLPEEIKPCIYSTDFYVDKTGKKKRKHACPTDYFCERKSRYLAGFWPHGFLDIIQTNSSPKLSFYLAKYLSKNQNIPSGKKRFFTCRKVFKPQTLSANKITLDKPFIKLINSLTPLQEKVFNTEWLGRALYRSYLLNNNNQHDSNTNTGDAFNSDK